MKKTIAIEIAGKLNSNSKMPCKTINLPTSACKTGSKLAQVKGSICSQCYASKGMAVVFAKTVNPSRQKALDGILHADWVEAMVAQIGSDKHFRWHSSGDVQSIEHFKRIVEVCNATPNTVHWMPTRERAIVKAYLNEGGIIPDNLVIRLSATFFDQGVKPFAGLCTSTAHKTGMPIGFECPAPTQGGACNECRSCWNKEVKNVSYKAH